MPKDQLQSLAHTVVPQVFSQFNLPVTTWATANYEQHDMNKTPHILHPKSTWSQQKLLQFCSRPSLQHVTVVLNEFQPQSRTLFLFGLTLITGRKVNLCINNLGIKWNTTGSNSSAVMFSAAVTQGLISRDEKFEVQSAKSSISYWSNYKTFKKSDVYGEIVRGGKSNIEIWNEVE
ncbi:hypothetical protein L218DRAFT_945748 [Marasmius fiardii PR-910]|nr:hypothetical protein L218DRAFT_945748 [Marasmius fiardii PR-910]